MPLFRPPYQCEGGRADSHYIPEFQLAEGLAVTKERIHQYKTMVSHKKECQHFFQSHCKSISQIRIPQDCDDLYDDRTTQQVYEHREAYCKIRARSRECDELRFNQTIPEIKIDKVNAQEQWMPPSQWNFEVAVQREISEEELSDRLGTYLLSPCQTRANNVPVLRSIKTDPVQSPTTDKDEAKKRLAKFWRRKSR